MVGLLVDRYPEAIELARVKAWRRLLLPPRRPEGDDGDRGSWEVSGQADTSLPASGFVSEIVYDHQGYRGLEGRAEAAWYEV